MKVAAEGFELYTQAEIEQKLVALGAKISPGSQVSAGELIGFTQGWALDIVRGGKAHYFKTNGRGYVYAVCGLTPHQEYPLYGAGSFQRCRKCNAKAVKNGW